MYSLPLHAYSVVLRNIIYIVNLILWVFLHHNQSLEVEVEESEFQ